MTNTIPLLFNNRHILPSGRIPLRIPVGQQQDTVVYVLKHGLSLGVCMEEEIHKSTSIGTMVSIEDFNLSSEDGALTITVEGQSSFLINEFIDQGNNIILASYLNLPNWPEREVSNDSAPLAEKLQSMFERYPELCSMYSKPRFDDLTWLCQRWLELLPLPSCEKQMLMSATTCNDTAEYLLSLMKEPH